jgi:hypothetical protein
MKGKSVIQMKSDFFWEPNSEEGIRSTYDFKNALVEITSSLSSFYAGLFFYKCISDFWGQKLATSIMFEGMLSRYRRILH